MIPVEYVSSSNAKEAVGTSVTFLNLEPLSLSLQHFSPVFFVFMVLCGGA